MVLRELAHIAYNNINDRIHQKARVLHYPSIDTSREKSRISAGSLIGMQKTAAIKHASIYRYSRVYTHVATPLITGAHSHAGVFFRAHPYNRAQSTKGINVRLHVYVYTYSSQEGKRRRKGMCVCVRVRASAIKQTLVQAFFHTENKRANFLS